MHRGQPVSDIGTPRGGHAPVMEHLLSRQSRPRARPVPPTGKLFGDGGQASTRDAPRQGPGCVSDATPSAAASLSVQCCGHTGGQVVVTACVRRMRHRSSWRCPCRGVRVCPFRVDRSPDGVRREPLRVMLIDVDGDRVGGSRPRAGAFRVGSLLPWSRSNVYWPVYGLLRCGFFEVSTRLSSGVLSCSLTHRTTPYAGSTYACGHRDSVLWTSCWEYGDGSGADRES